VNVVDPQSEPQQHTGRRSLSPVRIGRRIGTSLFWVLVIFVASSATLSIVTQVFPRLAREPLYTEARARCAKQIPELRDQLLVRARDLPGTADEPGLKSWFTAWDRRFHALGSHCGELEQTRVELQRLRDSIHAMLRRFERREAPRLERIQSAIDEYATSTNARNPS
jgi:hypothetical protein